MKSYNMHEFPKYLRTAGKVTVLTTLVAVVVFTAAFLLNLGGQHLKHAIAQVGNATTSITVLNTPPAWTVYPQETPNSASSTPTNAGTKQGWVAVGTDPNAQPYFLLICASSTAPTPHAAANYSSLGTAAPTCAAGVKQWAVSTSTISGTTAKAATTTTVAFPSVNAWYAWICDDDPDDPRCNAAYSQGTATSSSPFLVNHPPTFTSISNDSPKLPGQNVSFTTVASDADNFGTQDTVKLTVCATNSFSTTSGCAGLTLATSSFATTNPNGLYYIKIPTQDQVYNAYAFLVDNHNLAATGGAEGSNSSVTVANAAPYVDAADPSSVTLNNGANMSLITPAGTTTFPLEFKVKDNNSCVNAASGPELKLSQFKISVFRTDIGTSSCSTAGNYNPNNCYTSTIGTSTWDIKCTASSTSCTGATDPEEIYNCTFPLWYVADPTAGTASDTPHYATDWSAAISPVDDNGSSTPLTAGTVGQDLNGLLAVSLDTNAIPYGSLEPGKYTPILAASSATALRATGNVGVDEKLTGQSMCHTYTSGSHCSPSATSTIPEKEQVFATSTVTYGYATSTLGNTLSSTTLKRLNLGVPKPTSTTQQPTRNTYWGIAVPSTITYAGTYTGENTFYAAQSNTSRW